MDDEHQEEPLAPDPSSHSRGLVWFVVIAVAVVGVLWYLHRRGVPGAGVGPAAAAPNVSLWIPLE